MSSTEMESPCETFNLSRPKTRGVHDPNESVVKQLFSMPEAGGTESVEGTNAPRVSEVLFGSPKIVEVGAEKSSSSRKFQWEIEDPADPHLSTSDSGALFAQVLNESRASDRVSDRDIVNEFMGMFSMAHTDAQMMKSFVHDGIPCSFETFVSVAEKKWPWFKSLRSRFVESMKQDEGLALRDSLQDHLTDFRSSSGSSAISVLLMCIHDLTQNRTKTTWVVSEKETERRMHFCSSRAVEWLHQFLACDEKNLETVLYELSLGKESGHSLEYEDRHVTTMPGSKLLLSLVEASTAATTRILVAIQLSLLNYVAEEKILDLDPQRARSQYLIQGSSDHPSCMPPDGTQTASQWLAQDDSQVRSLQKLFRVSKMPHLAISEMERKAQLKEGSSKSHWTIILDECEKQKILWEQLPYVTTRQLFLESQDTVNRRLKNNLHRRLLNKPGSKGDRDQKDSKKPGSDQKTKSGKDFKKPSPSDQRPKSEKGNDAPNSDRKQKPEVASKWEAAEKNCPKDSDMEEHLKRSARGHMLCNRQSLPEGALSDRTVSSSTVMPRLQVRSMSWRLA